MFLGEKEKEICRKGPGGSCSLAQGLVGLSLQTSRVSVYRVPEQGCSSMFAGSFLCVWQREPPVWLVLNVMPSLQWEKGLDVAWRKHDFVVVVV